MNGRCDNDPLDPTDDVCDLCGGEFCSGCLVAATKRNKTVACKSCTMINSGVRPGKITRVRSKRDAKKRREEIANEHSSLRAEGRFVFFDDCDEPRHHPAEPKKSIRERLHHDDHLLDGVEAIESAHFVDDPNEAAPAVQHAADDASDDWLTMLDLAVEKPPVPTMDDLYAVPNAPAMERLEKLRATTEPEPVFVPLDPSATVIAPMSETERPASFDEVDPFASAPEPEPEPEPEPDVTPPAPMAPPTVKAPEPTMPSPRPTPPPAPIAQTEPDVTPPAPIAAPKPAPVAAAPKPVAPKPVTPKPVAAAAKPVAEKPVAQAPQPKAAPAQPAAVPAALQVPAAFRPKAPESTPTRRSDDAVPASTSSKAALVDEVDERGAWIPPALRGVSS